MATHKTEIFIESQEGEQLLRRPLPPGRYVLGREETCDIRIDAELLAPQQAELTIEKSGMSIEDLSGGEGISIGGRRIRGLARLWPNQSVQLGSVTLRMRPLRDSVGVDELGPVEEMVQRWFPEESLREGKYALHGELARGAMGVIIEAKETLTERRVAMKLMLDASGVEDLTRFVAEAKITAQLEHPNIVPVHELGIDAGGNVFYTMKYVRGVTLREVLDGLAKGDAAMITKYPLAVLLTIFQKVCDALAFAHSHDVIHRDLKPANIMLGDFGEVLVMDWGLAKVISARRGVGADKASAAAPHASAMRVRDFRSQVDGFATTVGLAIGTPQYMSPEQARGETDSLDARSDIYALGAILYHILTLQAPHEGKRLIEILRKAIEGDIFPPSERVRLGKQECPHLPDGRVPESLDAVCRKAMVREVEGRYARVEDLQRDLLAYQSGFVTSAEEATLWKHARLLMRRHRAIFAVVSTCLALLAGMSVFFTVRLLRERNAAVTEGRRAEAARVRALQSRAEADGEKNRADVAETEAAMQRARADKARAETEAERAQAKQEMEAERSRAQQVQQESAAELSRAQQVQQEKDAALSRVKKAFSTLSVKREGAGAAINMKEMKSVLSPAELNAVAADFFARAAELRDQGKLDEAIDKVNQAIQIDDVNANYILFRANLREVMGQITPALTDYRRVEQLNPATEGAAVNLALCERLSRASNGAAVLSPNLNVELWNGLLEQHRSKDAGLMAARLAAEAATERTMQQRR